MATGHTIFSLTKDVKYLQEYNRLCTMIFALCYNYTSYKIICTAHDNSIFFKSMPSNEVVKGNDVFNLPIQMIDSGGKIMKSISLIH
jgi:hypothetical protein